MNSEKALFNAGIIPVIKLDDAGDALPLCAALKNGGLFTAEVTFRTAAAESSIRQIAEKMSEILVGAGTVSNVETVKKAVAAGAKFIVSPGFNPAVVGYCVENGIDVYPGISSATDIEAALTHGLTVLKFFPAEASGGLAALKALSGPYPQLRFIPTGGINEQNLQDYLAFDKVLACGGSWMVADSLLKEKNFDGVEMLTKQAVAKMHNFRFAHLAVNQDDQAGALKLAERFNFIFKTGFRVTSQGAFAGENVETINNRDVGVHGHIGFRTANLARAIAYFQAIGVEIDPATLRGPAEKPTFVYLKEDFGGFKVHVMQG